MTARSFETIGAYDRDDHAFRREVIVEESYGYETKPYRGSFYCAWTRYLDFGETAPRVRYAVMSDCAGFVASELESAGFDFLSDLVPHDYVEVPEQARMRSLALLPEACASTPAATRCSMARSRRPRPDVSPPASTHCEGPPWQRPRLSSGGLPVQPRYATTTRRAGRG